MSLYTKSGDTGMTQLYGGGRTSKSAPRIHAVGTVDELSAILGVIVAEMDGETTFQETPFPSSPRLRRTSWASLRRIQRMLHVVGADLSGSATRVTPENVAEIEWWIDEAEGKVPRLRHFILPGGTRVGALLHLARTVCRRAERWVTALSEVEETNPECLKYLNRLGDFLFAIARVVNRENGVKETEADASCCS